jgi:flagellar hook-basal body complex protein FliE
MNIKELGGIAPTGATGAATKVGNTSPVQKDFSAYLKDAVGEVNDLQQKASQAIQTLVGEGKGDLQDTLVALEKADVSFRLMMQIRNKIVEAYQEIVRMQM